nr:MAG TPA: hypothetical protein [Caudoviricetes sp.]
MSSGYTSEINHVKNSVIGLETKAQKMSPIFTEMIIERMPFLLIPDPALTRLTALAD